MSTPESIQGQNAERRGQSGARVKPLKFGARSDYPQRNWFEQKSGRKNGEKPSMN